MAISTSSSERAILPVVTRQPRVSCVLGAPREACLHHQQQEPKKCVSDLVRLYLLVQGGKTLVLVQGFPGEPPDESVSTIKFDSFISN